MDTITALPTLIQNWLGAGWEWLLSDEGTKITVVLASLATIILFVVPIAKRLFFWKKRKKASPQPITIPPEQQNRNRQRMLEKVRHMWIEGVLEKSLYHEARLELGFQETSNMVEHSLNLVVEQLGHQSETIRDGTPMIELFDRFDKTLLILGAPGAGKTTLLLELARDLIERAEHENEHPIPVIFSLSSWALQRPVIADWLIDELRKRYNVPGKIARFWIENEAILPLLDGLDEVAKEHRNTCVEAINTFREQNGLLPIAICSRIADYEALTTKLSLQHAVTVQPLTSEQVDRYLAQGGESLEPVRKLVKEDETLMELLDNPLMLSIMQIAFFNNADAATTLENGSIENRRKNLFDTYITAMFKRRNTHAPYKTGQTKQWLSRFAKSMIQREQTIFYVEQLQPDFLSKNRQTMFTVIYLTASVLVLWLIVWLSTGFLGWVFRFLVGLSVLIFALSFGLASWLHGNILLAEGSFELSELINNEKLNKKMLVSGLVAGLGIWLGALLSSGLSGRMFFGLSLWLVLGFSIWLALGPLNGLTDKESALFQRISERATPNKGVHRSLKNAIFFVLLLGGLSGLVLGLIGGLNAGIASGLFIGLFAGMELGGFAVIQHYVLRLLLWLEGFAPLRYVRFLDQAADLLFLRKVGGGYIFVHRMIMEHFAAMADAKPATRNPSVESAA